MGNASRLATPDWDAEALQNLMMSLLGLPPECLTHPADKAVLIQHLNTAHRIAEQLYQVPIAHDSLELASTFSATLESSEGLFDDHQHLTGW